MISYQTLLNNLVEVNQEPRITISRVIKPVRIAFNRTELTAMGFLQAELGQGINQQGKIAQKSSNQHPIRW